MYDSPHKYINNKNGTFNFKQEEILEIESNSINISNELIQLQNPEYGKILRVFLWNSIGDGKKGYSECRMMINQENTRDTQFDLYVTQEPAYTKEENYLKCFNLTEEKYQITYPPDSKDQVAIIFNKQKLSIDEDGHKNSYKLIEESRKKENNQGIEYTTQFPKYGQKRIQIVHFKIQNEIDDMEADGCLKLCVINIHSVHNNYTIEKKKTFILEFFKFVNWYINNKLANEPIKLLILGDFNLDLINEDIDQLVYDEIGLNLVISTSPKIDAHYSEDDISKTNIDFFCTVYNKNYVNIHNVSKIPLRFENYYKDFQMIQDFIKTHQLNVKKISTHDPQFCYLTFNS
ncbi:hypothetical protein DICPUDRAFT_42092, partial [Dictyostelium purpureum]